MVTDSQVEEKYLTGGTIRASGLRVSRVSALKLKKEPRS